MVQTFTFTDARNRQTSTLVGNHDECRCRRNNDEGGKICLMGAAAKCTTVVHTNTRRWYEGQLDYPSTHRVVLLVLVLELPEILLFGEVVATAQRGLLAAIARTLIHALSAAFETEHPLGGVF